MDVQAFIQARMSSRRFPGKVLARLQGRTLLQHVVDRVAEALPRERIVVATSGDPSDEPVAALARDLGVAAFRGPLDDVFERFRRCLRAHPCAWFFRVSADSPRMDGALMRSFLPHAERADLDLVTNVFPRTFPRGQSVEMIRADRFSAIDAPSLTDEEREHVTKVYYNHPAGYRILNIESGDPSRAETNLCVDTPDDLARLERGIPA